MLILFDAKSSDMCRNLPKERLPSPVSLQKSMFFLRLRRPFRLPALLRGDHPSIIERPQVLPEKRFLTPESRR